jgi:hypothetical protein
VWDKRKSLKKYAVYIRFCCCFDPDEFTIYSGQVAKPLVDHVLEGYNSTCFAYGQTGSGKTYCIFGPPDDKDKRGIVPRCMEYVFKQAEAKSRGKKISFSLSFLEIYLEKIRDLGRYYMEAKGGLPASAVSSRHNSRPGSAMRPSSSHGSTSALNVNTSSRPPSATASMSARSSNLEQDYESQNLEIHQDANGTVFVKDLISVPVSSVEEVMEVVTVGVAKRRTHETAMNSVSSRSHTCFTLTVTQTDRRDNSVLVGHLHLIDLAGSERIAKSGSSGQRLQEAVMINSSLTGLGKVVVALNSGSATQHIPYRESKLTRLLQVFIFFSPILLFFMFNIIFVSEFIGWQFVHHIAGHCQPFFGAFRRINQYSAVRLALSQCSKCSVCQLCLGRRRRSIGRTAEIDCQTARRQ